MTSLKNKIEPAGMYRYKKAIDYLTVKSIALYQIFLLSSDKNISSVIVKTIAWLN